MIKRINNNLGFALVLLGLSIITGEMAAAPMERFAVSVLKGKTHIMPVLVIGSGPAGLMASVYGARDGYHTLVIEGDKPGGLLTDTTEVENWPGSISIMGPEVPGNIRKQAKHLGADFLTGSVERIDTSSWPFKVHLDDETEINALTIIIATGASPKMLGIPGEQKYWGMGVSSCATCDAPFYKGMDVVVIGGGDSAAEEAMQLAQHVRKVTIIVRKDKMRAADRMQQLLGGYDNVSILYNSSVKEVLGDGQIMTSIKLFNNKTDELTTLPIDGLFLAIGHNPNSDVVKDIVDCDATGYIKTEGRTQKTSQEGLFVAGDVHDHRYRQAGTAAGFGIAAGLDAVAWLRDVGFSNQKVADLGIKLFEVPLEEGADAAHELELGT